MGFLTKVVINHQVRGYVKRRHKEAKYSQYDDDYLYNQTMENNNFITIFEFIANDSIENIKAGSLFNYYRLRQKLFQIKNDEYLGFMIHGLEAEAIEYNQAKQIPLYQEYSKDEALSMWLEDRWNDPMRKSKFNLNSKNSIWETYKKQFKYKGDYKVYEIKDTSKFLKDAYKVFVCEELRIIYFFELCELKTTKGMFPTMYCDFENSPFFDEKYLTTNPQTRKEYNRKLKKMAKSVGYEEMNQEALLKIMKTKKNAVDKIFTAFRFDGYKWARRSVWHFMEQEMPSELYEICKTYTVFSNPYYFKAFTEWHIFNDCGVYYSSDFEDKRNTYGCKLSELEARKKLPTISEYFNLSEEDEWIVDTRLADEVERKKKRGEIK